MSAILEIRRCIGCNVYEHDTPLLIRVMSDIYLCMDCTCICVSVIAKEAPKNARIKFVDEITAIMKEPQEIVAKWKELEASKPPQEQKP